MKILMVCLGNICRSPLAEGIMKEKVRAHSLDWHIDSAGTGFWHSGEKPDHRSIKVARKYGIDITGQRARQIRPSDLDEFDLICAMDAQNYQDILRLASHPAQREKVHLIMNFAHPGENRSVPDPYYEDEGFEEVYRMLEKACEGILGGWRSEMVKR